jgi:hypothetical protein
MESKEEEEEEWEEEKEEEGEEEKGFIRARSPHPGGGLK